jgi:hypothetical protein
MRIIEHALDLNLSIRGENHPLTMDTLYNKAENLYSKGLYKESADILEKVVKFSENWFGKDHLQTGNAYNL